MNTCPLFNDQFINEKMLVDVVRIGVSIGSKVNSLNEEKRTLVKAEDVKKAVNKEANERRKRANEVAKMAKKAVKEGGSSYNGMSRLIQ